MLAFGSLSASSSSVRSSVSGVRSSCEAFATNCRCASKDVSRRASRPSTVLPSRLSSSIVQTASFGLVPDTWSANQLAYQLAFRYADFNGAAAIAVDLLMIGLVGAVLIVTRSGLFRTDD
jgi:hypothetical protein